MYTVKPVEKGHPRERHNNEGYLFNLISEKLSKYGLTGLSLYSGGL